MSIFENITLWLGGFFALLGSCLLLLDDRLSPSSMLITKARAIVAVLQSAQLSEKASAILSKPFDRILNGGQLDAALKERLWIIDGALLIPIYVYGQIPSFPGTWEFRFLPVPVYYFAAVALIVWFFRWLLKIMDKKRSRSAGLLAPALFVWLCSNVILMNATFLSLPKTQLLEWIEGSGAQALLGLPFLLGYMWSLMLALLFVAWSTGVLLSFLLLFLGQLICSARKMAWVAWGVERSALHLGIVYGALFLLSPDQEIFPSSLFRISLLVLAFSLMAFAAFFSLLDRFVDRPVVLSASLLHFPIFAIAVWMVLLIGGDLPPGWISLVVCVLILAHLWLPWLITTVFSLTATSLLVSRRIFGAREIANPLRSLGVCFQVLGAAFAFLSIQVKILIAWLS